MLNERAFGWLAELDACADGTELLTTLHTRYLQLAETERAAVLRRWWESTDPQLRLVAAIGYALGNHESGDPGKEELFAFLADLVRDGEDARLRRLALFAIASWHLVHPADECQSEIAIISRATEDSRSRTPALEVLRSLQRCALGQTLARSIDPWIDSIRRVLQDEDASLADTVTALRLALAMPDCVISEFRERIWEVLRDPDLAGGDFDFLANNAFGYPLTPVVAFVSDACVPFSRRVRALDLLMIPHNYVPSSWSDWSKVLDDPTTHPEIAAQVLRMLENRNAIDLQRIVRLARTPNLAPVLRRAIYHVLWTCAFKIDVSHDQVGLALSLLLDLEDAAAIARDVFTNETLPAFSGMVSPKTASALLARLRDLDPQADVFYRGVLALLLPLNTLPAFDDRCVVCEALLSFAETLAPAQRARIYWQIVGFARYSPRFNRALLWEERLELPYRLEIARIGVPRADLFRFVRDVPVGPTDRAILAACLESYFPAESEWHLGWQDERSDQLWNELRATPEFCEENTADLVGVLFDPGRSSFIHEVASCLVINHLRNRTVDASVIFQRLLDTARGLSPANAQSSNLRIERTFSDIVQKCFIQFQNPALGEAVATALWDTRIPERLRQIVARNLPDSFIYDSLPLVWHALSQIESRWVRAAVLDRLDHAVVLPRRNTVFRVRDQLREAQSPEEIAEVERTWAEILPIGRLFDADTVQLVIQAANLQPTMTRDAARDLLERRNVNHADRRRLWLYLNSQEARKIWDDDQLRDTVIRHATAGITSTRIGDIVARGPDHPLWPLVASLATLPDQALAAGVLALLRLNVSDREMLDWRFAHAPHVPDAGVLALHWLAETPDVRNDVARTLDGAFHKASSSHSESSELLHALLDVSSKPRGIVDRVATVLNHCSFDSESPENSPRALRDLLRFAQLEARLVARTTRELSGEFDREPDLKGNHYRSLLRLEDGMTAKQVVEKLQDRVCEQLLPHFPQMTTAQLSIILQETMAPAILTAHYLQVHRPGIPLLGEAIVAASEGLDSWEKWRFDRPAARGQLPHLDENDVAVWRKNWSTPVGIEVIPDEVCQAAATIRERFRRSLRDKEISADYQALIETTDIAPHAIQRYQEIVRELIGPAIGGVSVPDSTDLLASLPAPFADEIKKALTAHDRQTLLGVRYRIERAVDFLRLLNCDEGALSRNELRAHGEVGATRGESAVAHLKQVRVAFQKAPTRQLRETSGKESHQLDGAFADAQAALDRVKTFATSKQLVATEVSDFRTLIEIGNRPYGQGSCQNYGSNNRYNRGLLAYLTDAMIKAIVLHTAPTPDNPEGTPLARAIIRLGATRKSQLPVIVLEKTYAAGGEESRYRPFLKEAVKEIARQRGWRAAIPEHRRASPDVADDDQIVVIPKSQNGVQYEDGADAIVDGEGASMPTDAYALRVTYTF